MAWDQIAPARFNRYHDYGAIMPMLTTLHEKRAANDPDYRYLKDQVSIAQEARSITALPLQESGRVAMRDDQESKALVIENKRRMAKGLQPLDSLSGDGDEEAVVADALTETPEASSAEATDTAESSEDEEFGDVLLMETGRILVDAITLRPNTSVAGRRRTGSPKEPCNALLRLPNAQ